MASSKTKKPTNSSKVSPALEEYNRQVVKYEQELELWRRKRVRLMLPIIGLIDFFVGVAVALLIVALVQLTQKDYPPSTQTILLSGLILTVIFLFISLCCSATLFFWHRSMTGLPRSIGWVAFLGLFGGITVVNSALSLYAWIRTKEKNVERCQANRLEHQH